MKQYGSLSKKRIKGDASFRKAEQSRADHGNEDSKVCARLPPPPPPLPQRYANGGSGHYQQQAPQERSQRWVHLPVSFCEALRAFGAEFSCLFPCRKSCFSREKAEDRGRSYSIDNGCGDVVARWLAAEDGGGEVSIRGSRRHAFEDIEVKDDIVEVKGQNLDEEEARVSISLPPENALLLMRCRSDPMKMAALAPRFSWDARAAVPEHQDDIVKEEVRGLGEEGEEKTLLVFEPVEEQRIQNGEDDDNSELREEEFVVTTGEEREKEIDANEEDVFVERENDESESNMSSFEALLDQEKTEHYDDVSSAESHKREEQETEDSINTSDKETTFVNDDETENQELVIGDIQAAAVKERVLPECLLLMMCEPKLSMEVSKETWVCSTDFVRRLPERPSKPAKAAAAAVKRRQNTESRLKPKPSVPLPPTKKSDVQPARSSCSLPAATSMAAVIEQKLVKAGAYEPFALTRCKSEPMRTAAAKLVPETCFNASMKLEPQISVGAAGVGF